MPFFTRMQVAVILVVGILTPLIDSRVEVILVQFFASVRGSVNVFDFTGGPLNSDLLVSWEEYGAVVAAFLVRKPGSGTLAMTINGLGQFVVDGFSGPHHLLYGVSGVGVDLAFALFRYRRYDLWSVAFAGVMAQIFWIPVTYAYHDVFARFPVSFIAGDLATRMIGGAIGNGLLGAGIGLLTLRLYRGRRDTPSNS